MLWFFYYFIIVHTSLFVCMAYLYTSLFPYYIPLTSSQFLHIYIQKVDNVLLILCVCVILIAFVSVYLVLFTCCSLCIC